MQKYTFLVKSVYLFQRHVTQTNYLAFSIKLSVFLFHLNLSFLIVKFCITFLYPSKKLLIHWFYLLLCILFYKKFCNILLYFYYIFLFIIFRIFFWLFVFLVIFGWSKLFTLVIFTFIVFSWFVYMVLSMFSSRWC